MQNYNVRLMQKVLQAASQTDYYGRLFKREQIDVNQIEDYESFCKIPITSKQDYRENKFDFINYDKKKIIDIQKLVQNSSDFKSCDKVLEKAGFNMVITSGSTGVPLEVVHSNKDDARNYIQLNRYRARRNTFRLTEKYIWLLPMNEKTKCMFFDKNLQYISDENGIQYFLANYSEENLKKMHELVVREKPSWITASPTAMAAYAAYLKKHGREYHFNYIELHSEVCLPWQKRRIKEVFQTDYSMIYSSNEINFIAASCDNEKLHVLEENVFVELLPFEVDDATSYKVIITGLNYMDTPFIRYEIGDLARKCYCEKCGKEAIELTGYRCSDMIYKEDGSEGEPYIIYDSVFFMNAKIGCNVIYYEVTQTDYRKFRYELKYEITKELQQKMKLYLEEFLSNCLKETVEVEIQEARESRIQLNKKYKRFVSMVMY